MGEQGDIHRNKEAWPQCPFSIKVAAHGQYKKIPQEMRRVAHSHTCIALHFSINPLVPDAHNSVRQDKPFSLQIQRLEVDFKVNCRFLFSCTLGTNGLTANR